MVNAFRPAYLSWRRVVEVIWRIAVAALSMLCAIDCVRPAAETTQPRGTLAALLFVSNFAYHSTLSTMRLRGR
jgi:hypothetical protein